MKYGCVFVFLVVIFSGFCVVMNQRQIDQEIANCKDHGYDSIILNHNAVCITPKSGQLIFVGIQ